jgi:hypothetical protein
MILEKTIKKDQVKDKALERTRRLVKAVGREVVNRKGLIAALGLRQQGIRNFRMNYMIPAREAGYVVMQYAGTPHYHEQAYKLTQKGLDYLAEMEAQERTK